MEMNKEYTKEELLEHIKMLEKTIQVQHETINRMLDAFILKPETTTEPSANQVHLIYCFHFKKNCRKNIFVTVLFIFSEKTAKFDRDVIYA